MRRICKPDAFVRSEFEVVVSNWTVTGTGAGLFGCGAGEPAGGGPVGASWCLAGSWTECAEIIRAARFMIRTTHGRFGHRCTYSATPSAHALSGDSTATRARARSVSIVVDGGAASTSNLSIAAKTYCSDGLGSVTRRGHILSYCDARGSGRGLSISIFLNWRRRRAICRCFQHEAEADAGDGLGHGAFASRSRPNGRRG